MMLCKRSKCKIPLFLKGACADTALREILDLLGQLLGVFASLNSKWTKALLHRAQLSESHFLGEVLNAFQLIATSLGTPTIIPILSTHPELILPADSKPLPMIYNPLLELFLRPSEAVRAGHSYGYDVTMDEPVKGIPQHVDLETICSIEYLRFSCGISQCYAIMNVRLSLIGVASCADLARLYSVSIGSWYVKAASTSLRGEAH